MKMDSTAKASLAAFFSNVFFGFSFLFSKQALGEASPLVLLAYRFLLAFLLMNILIATKTVKVSLKGKDLRPLILLGLFQPVIYFLCENYGIMHSSTTFASVMIALIPMVSSLFSAVLLKERPTLLQTIFSAISVAGVIIMALQQKSEGAVSLVGVMLLIGAVISAAAFNLVSRKSSQSFSAFERTYFMFFLGSVIFTGLALGENIAQPLELIEPLKSATFLIALGYLGIMSSILAFLLVNYANSHLPLARSTIFANVTTVVSVVAGVVFLDESLNFISIVAAVMIVGGVWAVQRVAVK